jgi:hypothetical protein
MTTKRPRPAVREASRNLPSQAAARPVPLRFRPAATLFTALAAPCSPPCSPPPVPADRRLANDVFYDPKRSPDRRLQATRSVPANTLRPSAVANGQPKGLSCLVENWPFAKRAPTQRPIPKAKSP